MNTYQADYLTVGLVQMASGMEREENLQQVATLLEQAGDCDVVLFPEYVLSLGSDSTVRRAARSLEENDAELGALARGAGKSVIFGGVPLWAEGAGPHAYQQRRLYNVALAYGPDGQRLVRYDKIHLFQMDARDGSPRFDETTLFTHGQNPVCADVLGWRTAFSICYDLRFPELYRSMGIFDLLLCPAAFTRRSGEAHWHVLLRARAVENQCFVVAPAQCGVNADVRVPKYGHSLVIDPWGRVLLDAGPDAVGLFPVRLERTVLEDTRRQLPALENRRLHGVEHL